VFRAFLHNPIGDVSTVVEGSVVEGAIVDSSQSTSFAGLHSLRVLSKWRPS
jgi:hypothetical protein